MCRRLARERTETTMGGQGRAGTIPDEKGGGGACLARKGRTKTPGEANPGNDDIGREIKSAAIIARTNERTNTNERERERDRERPTRAVPALGLPLGLGVRGNFPFVISGFCCCFSRVYRRVNGVFYLFILSARPKRIVVVCGKRERK